MNTPEPSDLKNMLSDEEYRVTQEGGTEAPFSGEYFDSKEKGMYRCVVCHSELFSSDTKIDHDSYAHIPGIAGWPSFDEAIPGAVEFKEDLSHGMHRTEAVCANCGAHLGHVFDDPNSETVKRIDGTSSQSGKHFCINSCSLRLNEN